MDYIIDWFTDKIKQMFKKTKIYSILFFFNIDIGHKYIYFYIYRLLQIGPCPAYTLVFCTQYNCINSSQWYSKKSKCPKPYPWVFSHFLSSTSLSILVVYLILGKSTAITTKTVAPLFIYTEGSNPGTNSLSQTKPNIQPSPRNICSSDGGVENDGSENLESEKTYWKLCLIDKSAAPWNINLQRACSIPTAPQMTWTTAHSPSRGLQRRSKRMMKNVRRKEKPGYGK